MANAISKMQLGAVIATAMIIACGGLIGLYTLADAFANSIAASYQTGDGTHQPRKTVYDNTLALLSHTYQVTRLQCKSVPQDERAACISVARATLRHARAAAQLNYDCSGRATTLKTGFQATSIDLNLTAIEYSLGRFQRPLPLTSNRD